MEPTIRAAQPGDETALADIQTRSWRAAFAGILDDDTLKRLTDLRRVTNIYRRSLRSDQEKGYLLSVNGQPVGLAFWGPVRDATAADQAELICIHLLPNHWRRGYGRLLMQRVLADIRASDYSQAVLWVFRGNLRARAFYEAMGFSMTDMAKAAYGAEEVLYAIRL